MTRLPEVGETLDGKVQLVRLVGEGGMATVFEGRHTKLGTRVAVKVLAPQFARDPEIVQRFEREARAVAQLTTHHVPKVMDVQTEGAAPYMVMEFLDGRDLEAELGARGPLPTPDVADWVLQACAAVAEAHDRGIVHRDLKPANLFLAKVSGAQVVKVLDFGISKILSEATKLTAPSAVMGTLLYMPPEQVRASRDADARSDVWSIGVILYELLSGQPPFTGQPAEIARAILMTDPPLLSQRRATVPAALAQLVAQMLQRDPNRRPQSVREVMAALAPFAPAGCAGARDAEAVLAAAGGAGMLQAVKTAPMQKPTVRTPPETTAVPGGMIARSSGTLEVVPTMTRPSGAMAAMPAPASGAMPAARPSGAMPAVMPRSPAPMPMPMAASTSAPRNAVPAAMPASPSLPPVASSGGARWIWMVLVGLAVVGLALGALATHRARATKPVPTSAP